MKTTIPDSATIVPREDDDIVLAHGKVTGHKHRIPHRSAVLYRDENDARYLRGTAPMRLLHEEHGKVILPAGDYLCVIQRVWTDADEVINVED